MEFSMLRSSPQKPPRNRVDLSTEILVRHWCKRFGRSKQEIEAAIKKVGDNAENCKEAARNDAKLAANAATKASAPHAIRELLKRGFAADGFEAVGFRLKIRRIWCHR